MSDIESVQVGEEGGMRNTRLGRLFMDKRFVHYAWIGIFVSALNVFFLWLLIDIFHVPTIIASILVIGTTFVLRYVLLIFSKVL